MTTETRGSNSGRSRSCSEAGAYRYRVLLAPVRSSSRSRSQPSALWAINRVAVDVQQRFGGAVDAAHGVVGAAGAGRPGIQGLLVADLHQGLGDVVDVLDVDPAGDVGHGA